MLVTSHMPCATLPVVATVAALTVAATTVADTFVAATATIANAIAANEGCRRRAHHFHPSYRRHLCRCPHSLTHCL